MKSPTLNSAIPSARCAYRTPAGRRCRLPVADARSCLCPKHRAEQQQLQAADHYCHLSINYQEFQTAQGINHSLHNLYVLLAQNHISARRAAVLSYICSLLLRTLPQIDADIAAGIKYPPRPITPPVAIATDPAMNIELDPPLELNSGAQPNPDSSLDSVYPSSPEPPEEQSRTADDWDPSNPEPDPDKKPS